MKPMLLLLCVLAFLLTGCATRHQSLSSAHLPPAQTNAFELPFRVAAFAGDSIPATCSFQKARGQLGSVREGLSDFAEIAVGGPAYAVIIPGVIIGEYIDRVQDPYVATFVAAVSVAAGGLASAGAAVYAPVVAVEGIIRSRKTVSPQELAERETALRASLDEMAEQGQFQNFVLTAAEQKSPGRLIPVDLDVKLQRLPASVDAVFEARIEELRLERARSDDGSYFLRIKARARLLRQADNVILYEQPVEYRSGRALFLDWTYRGGLQSVAETGYRALADYYIRLIL